MGEIRFVGTGETRGYPYPVCKKYISIRINFIYPTRASLNLTLPKFSLSFSFYFLFSLHSTCFLFILNFLNLEY